VNNECVKHLRGRTEESYAIPSARTPALPTEIQIGHPANMSVNNNKVKGKASPVTGHESP
jgi:hypothetical protein